MDTRSASDRDADRRRRFPIGATVSLEALSGDPYPLFRRLRDREPVTWVPELDMWLLTRRKEILAVLADPECFTTDSPASTIRDVFGRQMLSSDGPDWIRYKRACMPPFRKEALMSDMNAVIGSAVDELVARLGRLEVADLRLGLSVPLSLDAVMRVMGLPVGDRDRVHVWYGHFAEALANFTGDPSVRQRGHESARAFNLYVQPFLDGSRPVPPGSLLSHLLEDEGRALTDAEVVSNLLIVLFGGVETADSMISTCLYALLTHPQLRSEAMETPSRLPAIVDEILRWDAPVQSCTRFATRATEIRGVAIEEGETVQCMLGAANRDPDWFPDPDRLDWARENAGDHLSFGAGRHFCLGAVMARMETEAASRAVIEAFPAASLVDPLEAKPVGHEFRRPSSLKVRLRP